MSIEVLSESHLREIQNIVSSWHSSMAKAQLNWDASQLEDVLKKSTYRLGMFEATQLGSSLVSFIIGHTIGGVLEIDILATHPGFLGKRYMTQLINKAKADFSKIWLEVHEDNHVAINFYIKQGFRIDGRRPRYYSDSRAALNMTFYSAEVE